MDNSNFPTARKSGLVIQEVPDEVLIFDLNSNKAHCLNETAALVWKACDGSTSVEQIARSLTSKTGKGVSDDLVWLAIDQLNENSLLDAPAAKAFKGSSRRDAIKKIGLASMIALPVVASLVAPQNALANVSCNCGQSGSSVQCSFDGFESCNTTCCNSAGLCAPPLGDGVCG